MASIYYVYVCVVAGEIRYFGKGKGPRIDQHARPHNLKLSDRFHQNLKAAIERNDTVDFYKIASNLTGDEALTLENYWIHRIGLGQLWNATAHKPYVSHDEFVKRHNEGMRRRSENPEWQANQKARMQRLWADPEFRAKHKAAASPAAKRRSENPEWKANAAAASRRNAADPVWQANHAAAMARNAASPEWHARVTEGVRRVTETLEWKENIAVAAALRRKPVIVDGIKYESVTAAGKALGLTKAAISFRIKKGRARFI